MFTKEERGKDGVTPSSAVESDLSKIGRYHAIVRMEITKAPAGAWTGKLITGQTRGSADVAAAPAPMHKDARALYEIWQRHARTNGDIPGAMVGGLATAVKTFIGYNPTWETVPKLNAILPRLDASHDWKPADAIALLDAVAAVQDSPLLTAAEKTAAATIRKGEALPEKFARVAWGETQPELWVCNPGEKDVKFQHSGRRDIGLRVFMKGADGKEHAADIAQFDGLPVFSRALLPAGHVFKAKEFSVVLLPPGGKAAGAEPHFTLPPGDYTFRTELKLPGTTGTGANGEQIIPAEGEWSGTIKSASVEVKLAAP